ncbi:MAG: ATP-binding protein [Endomicrobiales bacterium]|jgi:signal transduction histidine kinase
MTTLTLIVLLSIVVAEAGFILYLIARHTRSTIKQSSCTDEAISRSKIDAIGIFSSIVSHELKNPLASLKNIAYFFSKMPALEDPRANRMMSIMGTEVERINDQIVNLLDVSRVKRIDKQLCSIDTLVEDAFQKIALPDTIKVSKNVEQITLLFDSQRFIQIITALITNARDAMPKGGTIDFSLKRNGSNADIVFHDTGIGMDPATSARAFEPLFTTKTKVLGLGLTMAREILNIHNGQIELSSQKDVGTTVKITFPIIVETITKTVHTT